MRETARFDAPLGAAGTVLSDGWEFLLTDPGVHERPDELSGLALTPALVPGTVASALRALGRFSFDASVDFDAKDAWYRCRFARPSSAAGDRIRLCFDGLATLADVYLNGAHLFTSDNMFIAHALDVTDALRSENELVLRFRALAPAIKLKKPRPRWRTRIVEVQQLRYFRTSLLGRTPGFCPSVAPLGPFRPARLEVARDGLVRGVELSARLEGANGVITLRALIDLFGERRIESAGLAIRGAEAPLAIAINEDGSWSVSGRLLVPDAPLWWPHTHGESPLTDVELVVRLSGGGLVHHVLGRVGFRAITYDTSDGGFVLRVNGERVFCRGVCWTPLDIVGLGASPDEYRRSLRLLRDAGMNMIRVGGTMLYEDDAFHDACDELGILVWQDFMFANMDYPCGDEAFEESVRDEAAQVVARLRHRPSTAVFCGSSEVEQQAAMLGLPRDTWTNRLFSETLPALVRAACPELPYWSSSPTGGALPFQVNTGISHYYGVGAYQRPFEDARRANVRFTAECLAFANVPEESTLERLLPEGTPPVHHPRWKARVPRDRGAGWDFDDVRDHYLERLFGIAARELRYGDAARYLEVSRVVSGEAMHRAFSEWRRWGSTCNGALVWFYRDFWPGAGWGVVDAMGAPKAAYWHLRRVLQPRALLVSDEGLDGLVLHAVNELVEGIDIELSVTLYRLGETKVAEGATLVHVAPRATLSVAAQSILETFVDTTYAYRFGPPSHDLVVATMKDAISGQAFGSAFHFPLGLPFQREADVGLEVTAAALREGVFDLTVSTRRFAQSVALDIPGGLPDDDYFHLAPGAQKKVRVEMRGAGAKLQGTARALNAHAATKIRLS